VSAAERFGAPAQIRLSELSIFNLPPRNRIMAVIKGYFDDSRSNKDDGHSNRNIWTLAGYAGNDDQWRRFETEWPKLMADHGVPWFHMKEFGEPNGVYSKWYPYEDHQNEIIHFLQDITRIIGFSFLDGFFFDRYRRRLEKI
jgi:hypothetical protein